MRDELESSQIIGADLCTLARLLNDYSVCADTSALETAGQNCQYLNEANCWKYNLGKLVFQIDKMGSQIPFDSYDLSVSLTVHIAGNLDNEVETIKDPLKRLSFDIEIEGFRDNLTTQELDVMYSSWHLDRHIIEEGDGDNKFVHPIYHFSFGGNKMEEKGDIFGNSLVLPTPRIAHPPMDAILGIDFILQNYFTREKISKIVSDPEYIGIMKRAQERLLKPYFLSIVSFWNDSLFKVKEEFIKLHDQFSSHLLYPTFYK